MWYLVNGSKNVCVTFAWCRIGDVYPDNMVQVSVRLYMYRWNEHSDDDPGNAHYQASARAFCT